MESSELTKLEYLKSAAYTATNQHRCVLKGYVSYEAGRATVLKWMGFGLEDGRKYNMVEYFKLNDPDLDAELQKELRKEVWDALEFFDLI